MDVQGIRVALLAGGNSRERDISLASAEGAGSALRQAGFRVTQLDPASTEDLKRLIDGGFDVAFLCLHGKGGEDGAMQGMLEVLGIPYTGPGVWSSATAMDKAKAKVVYERCGIPTPKSVTLAERGQASAAALLDELGCPCVVKPAGEGSALGVSIARDEDAVAAALDAAFSHGMDVVVESYVSGTELTVAVIGNENAQALPVIQIVPRNEFYDFESKYAPGGSRHICPAPIDESAAAAAQGLALACHKALECRGMSRTDIILDAGGQAWVLETNTIPGMTATSLLPDAARAAGIEFPDLCRMLIAFALEGR